MAAVSCVMLAEKVFDVDIFLRAITMEVMSGQTDGIYNANNYWLYYNKSLKQFQYFRHDFDLSYGMFENWMGMVDCDIYTWGFKGRGRILLTRILSVPSFRASYSSYLRQFIRSYFNPLSSLIPRMDQLGREISPALARVCGRQQSSSCMVDCANSLTNECEPQDEWHVLDYAWTFASFKQSFRTNIERQAQPPPTAKDLTMGIVPFIEQRVAATLEQLDQE
jgi:hypothetical protein